MKKIIAALFIATCLIIFSGIFVSASTIDSINAYLTQVQFNNFFSQKESPTSSSLAGTEGIDYANGGLSIVKTDLILPGVGGHDVTLTRRFNSSTPMDNSGNIYYVNVGSRISTSEQHYSYKYVFKYYVEGSESQEVVYIAYDSIADMLEAENGTNKITTSLNYKDECEFNVVSNSNYMISVVTNDIGLGTNTPFCIYSMMPEGEDVTLVRDASLGYAELGLDSIYSYEYISNSYKHYYSMGGGWIYDIPMLNYVSRTLISSEVGYKEYGETYLLTDPESGKSLYVYVDYEIETDRDKVRVYEEEIGYYDSASARSMEYIDSYTVNFDWSWTDEDAFLEITDDTGKTYVFDVTSKSRIQLLSCTDRFGNIITYDKRGITDTLGRRIEFMDDLTVNGQEVVTFEKIQENDTVADPNDHLYVDDTYMLKVSNKTGEKDDGTTVYNYKVGNLKWYTSNDIYKPFVSTSDADHFIMESIVLPTGARTEYTYDYVTEDMTNNDGRKEILKVTSRYDVVDNVTKNKITYDYDSSDVYDTITTVRYENKPNYTLIKKYDDEDNMVQEIEENTDEGNKYYIVKDYTYKTSEMGRQVPTKIVTTTKSNADDTGNSVTELYEYDEHDNVVKTTRDDEVMQIASYNKYNLMVYNFNRKDSSYYAGISNNIASSGKTITTSRNAGRKTTSTTISSVASTSYSYSDKGDVTSVNGEGVRTNIAYTYTTYDETNPTADYLTVTYTVEDVPTIDGTADEPVEQDIVTTKTYDFLGRLVLETDAKGNTTRYEYDSRNNVVKVINPDNTFATNEYDYINNIIVSTDETGRKTKSEYDELGYFKKGYLYDGTTWKAVTENVYDTSNNIQESKIFNDDGTLKGKATYTYYTDNKPSQELVFDGTTVVGKKQYKYYPYHSDNNAATETVAYTSENKYATVTQYTDKYGYKTKDTVAFDGNTYTQSYTTDYLGNITGVKDFKANAEGDTDNTVSYTYDYAGKVLTETTSDGKISYTYSNSFGFLTSVKDRNDVETKYSYDEMGRIEKEESSDKKVVYYYDANDNLAQTRNYINSTTYNTSKNVYDSRNMLSYVITKPDETNIITKYVYDESGRPLKVAEGLSSVDEEINSATHRVTEYTYDAYGNVSAETDPMGGITQYRYNVLGMMVGKTDKNGTNTSYSYDVNGNVLNTSYVTAKGETDSISYTYDMVGNVISMVDNIGTTEYNYDSIGNLLSEITDNSAKTYTYDANGNATSFVLTVDGEQQQNLTYTYDNLSRVEKITDGNNSVEYDYDANGNILREYSRIGTAIKKKTEYTYTDSNLPKTKKVTTGSDYENYTMTYDWLGNTKTVTSNIKDSVSSTTNENVTTYTYDGIGRLMAETYSDGTGINYIYDKYNNMTSKTDGTKNVSYLYDKNNKLTSSTETGTDVTNKYSYFYDYNGNLITKSQQTMYSESESDEEQINLSVNNSPYLSTYKYDGWNRLTDANVGETVASYKYRGNNLREEKTVTNADGTKTIYFVYNGMDIVYDDDGATHNNYVRGLNGIAYRTDSNGTLNYFRTNQHGDVTSITSTAGTINQSYEYDAYGNLTNQTGTDENPFQYCGEYYDEETGFIYLRNRYYDPSIGRFITEDPAKDQLNWYAYCGGNPVRFVDSWGLEYQFNGSNKEKDRFMEYIRTYSGDTRYYLDKSGVLCYDAKRDNLYNRAKGSETFRNMLEVGMNSKSKITIEFNKNMEFSQTIMYSDGKVVEPNDYNKNDYLSNRCVNIILGKDYDFSHENAHGVDWVSEADQYVFYDDYANQALAFGYYAEVRAITLSNVINDEVGVPINEECYKDTYFRNYYFINNEKYYYETPIQYGMFPFEIPKDVLGGNARVDKSVYYGVDIYKKYGEYFAK